MKNYLNNGYHKEILSCGMRHMASVSLNCIGSTIGYDSGFINIANDKKIIKFIADHIESTRSFWKWGEYYKIGKIKFVLSHHKEEGLNLTIFDKNCSYGKERDVFCDLRFVNWFVYNYDFSGLGEIEERVYQLVRSYLESLSEMCVNQFHKQCNPQVNRRNYNPEVCGRNIAMCFWACQTFINAIEAKSYDALNFTHYKSTGDCVNEFEDIVNKLNGTNYMYSRLYYNEESRKRESEANYQIVRAALGLR